MPFRHIICGILPLRLPEVYAGFERNEKHAVNSIKHLFFNLKGCFYVVINIIDPDIVLIGSGASENMGISINEKHNWELYLFS
jgi:hypothetical protein